MADPNVHLFGLAAEVARAAGLNTDMVLKAALETPPAGFALLKGEMLVTRQCMEAAVAAAAAGGMGQQAALLSASESIFPDCVDRPDTRSPVVPEAVAPSRLADGLEELHLEGALAQGAPGVVASHSQHALLSSVEARLTQEVRRLIAALSQFGRRAQAIGELLPDDAKFCKLVTGSLALLGLQLAYSFGKGLDTPIFFDDGAQYLADLGLSLNEFVREVDLDGRRFLAVALIDQQLSQVHGAADAGDEQ